jgi:hypothetical protein
MKTEDIIEAGFSSFYTLVDIIKKKINFEKVPMIRMKNVLEGRYLAFTVAAEQLNKLKDLQDLIGVFDKDDFIRDAKMLIDATTYVLEELNKSLNMIILVNENTDDEPLKNIVLTKKIAFNFILEIQSTKESLENKVKHDFSGKAIKKDFATLRVKDKINETT